MFLLPPTFPMTQNASFSLDLDVPDSHTGKLRTWALRCSAELASIISHIIKLLTCSATILLT